VVPPAKLFTPVSVGVLSTEYARAAALSYSARTRLSCVDVPITGVDVPITGVDVPITGVDVPITDAVRIATTVGGLDDFAGPQFPSPHSSVS